MKINYVIEGNGEKTIVFIHGLSDSLDYWRILTSQLTDEYQMLIYDIRGHGKSPYEPFTIDLLVEDLHNLLLRLNIKKASLAGLSLGGNIALAFAIAYPEIVEKLIIMSSFSEVDENLKSKFLEFKKAIDISYEELFDIMIRYVLPDDVFEENKELLEALKVEASKTANPEAIKNGINMGIDFNVSDKLNAIDKPALILAGRDDEITRLNLAEILNENIKDSKLIVFDSTRHNLLIGRNTPQILKLIRQFI